MRVKRTSSNTSKRIERVKEGESHPTRFYSTKQEKNVAETFDGQRTLNSGATPFSKGDIMLDDILLECKTKTKNSDSISIKKEWLEKNEKESLFMGKPYSALVFNFGPNSKNYYVVDEEMFQMIISNAKDE